MEISQLQTKTTQQIRQKISFIYSHLIKLGYPKILQLSLSNTQQIQTYLSAYFQFTPSRLQLIQWLISVISPQYREMSWYITEKDPLNKLVKSLWRIGVMPVNKHTKNLDYKKYVQGMIGYENAVVLIHQLVELAFQSVLIKKSKQDVGFGQFFHELIENSTQLVNENYDLYGITFPCKFIDPNTNTLNTKTQSSQNKDEKQEYLDEFQKQYNNFYEEKMLSLLQKEDEIFDKIYRQKERSKKVQGLQIQLSSTKKKQIPVQKQQNPQSQIQQFVQNLSKYGRQYHQKYCKLLSKVNLLLSSPQAKSRLASYFLQKKQQTASTLTSSKSNITLKKKSIKQSIEARSIKISPQFCKKYQQYKRILRQVKTPKDDKEFMEKRSKILEKLYEINENVCI